MCVCVCVYICLQCKWIFTCSLSPVPLGFVCFCFVCHQHLEPSIDTVNESNMGSFFNETVYDAASTIDYSKEPLDAGVIDSPPPKQIFRQSPSSSPLKGIDRDCVRPSPAREGGSITPQRQLCMNTRPTKNASLPIPLRDALSLPSNSDANARRAKVSRPRLPPMANPFYCSHSIFKGACDMFGCVSPN